MIQLALENGHFQRRDCLKMKTLNFTLLREEISKFTPFLCEMVFRIMDMQFRQHQEEMMIHKK